MQMGNFMGIAVNSIYSSEVQFGYEKKNKCFLYLIDGQRYKLREIYERSDAAGLNRDTVVKRVLAHHSHTWEELLRPAASGQPRNESDKAKKNEKIARKLRRKIASEQAAKDKRAHFARLKSCHADIS